MGGERPVTPDEIHTMRLMRREGKSVRYIAKHLNRNPSTINEYCRGFAENRAWQQYDTDSPRIPDSVLIERAKRSSLAPRDLTAAIFGDPLPGFSALERRT